MNYFENVKLNDRVWDCRYGYGIVIDIEKEYEFFSVEFDDTRHIEDFNFAGITRHYDYACNQTLFYIDDIPNNVINKIEKWQKERLLNQQEFNMTNEFTNIIEEMFEIVGYKITKERRPALKKWVEDFFMLNLPEKEKKKFDDYVGISEEKIVDGINDIMVFCIGMLMKLGYDPKCTLYETWKEIDSRKGKIVDGKFQKDTSPEAKTKWVKADYKNCKINLDKGYKND